MAAPAPSQRLPSTPSSSGPSSVPSRWARTSEPGSAFNGLTRGARGGRGSGRGRGGGRGGRNGTAQDGRPIGGEASGDKADNTSKKAPTPAVKPAALLTSSATEKPPSVPSNAPARPKAPSRRASRTIPPAVVPPPIVVADIPSSPSVSRPQQRRRRSQSGKLSAAPLPKIHVPPHDDNLLRPQRNRLGPVPHSAPIKDAPPHLAGTFDLRNNIDALVERVRAVAMADNRPSTPGSHIDWAGDDDDSLPDLDDWGVTPATGVGAKTELMSPIIVDGLKSLPGVDVRPLTPPHKNHAIAPESLPTPSYGKLEIVDEKKALPAAPSPNFAQGSNTGSTKPPPSSSVPSKAALHPSLPAKPAVASDVASILPNSRQGPGATPMRKQPHVPKPAPVAAEKPASPTPPSAVQAPELPETDTEQSIEIRASEQGLAQSIHSPSAPETVKEDPFLDLKPRDGLTASIHAPGGLLETQSAPSDIPSYPSTTVEHRTHTRAHTVGRPPSFPRSDLHSRPSRSGYSTPRSGLSPGGHHARTHSSPPAGALLNSHRNPASHRPIITRDAMSLLTRTIGSTATSPGRPATSIATHD